MWGTCLRLFLPHFTSASSDAPPDGARRMQRFAAVTPVSLPDLVLH
jgi:hypothetical protein